MNTGNHDLMNVSGVSCYEENGTAYLRLEDVARGLGFTDSSKNGEYVRWARVDKLLGDIGFATCGERPDYIPENIFYRLAMKAKNETAEKFQALVADEIIPSIRRTGGYQSKKMCIEDVLIQSLIEMKQTRELAERAKEKVDHISDLVVINPNAWREECRQMVSKMAQARGGGGAYQEVNAEIYEAVDARAGCSLATRLTNLRRRMAEEGVCKSKRDKTTKMDVIAADKRLVEIYIAVVKDMAIKYEV